jgi:hypothetical protein
MEDAVKFAQAYEQRLSTPAPSLQPWATQRTATRPGISAPTTSVLSTASSPSVANKPPTTLKLTPSQVADRRRKNQCFHCNEQYSLGHKEQCKQLFIIEVIAEDGEATQTIDNPTISLHALTGIQLRSGCTMQVAVAINRFFLSALLDSRSTHNFVDTTAAERVGLPLHAHKGLRVAITNGDRVGRPGCYCALVITIDDEQFSIDCYGLALGSYDMVLSVQWLESLGPILWDLHNRTMAFVRNGHRMRWTMEGASQQPALLAAKGDLMEELLLRFDSLFIEPSGLPPERERCHHIHLILGTAPVAVRPYRYAHAQKQELERQCAEMLRTGVIRPSTSAFSVPVLLVKKHDGSWRFCIDYCALNAVTVKDRFPILVVELLDELRGAEFFTKLDLQSGYHQVRMAVDDIDKIAFRTHEGLFEFLMMPFGLTNASATFQAMMNVILNPFLRQFVLVFFNDILIFKCLWSKHLRHVHIILSKL